MPNRVRLGDFEADLDSFELFRGAQKIELQRQPFRVLAVLMEHAGELVTRELLCRRLWPNGVIVDFEHSLNTAVRKIRRALGDPPERPRMLETIPGRGFRLLVPVGRSAPVTPPCREALQPSRDELREIAVSLAAELVDDPTGPVATVVAALFVGSEDSFRTAQDLRRRANEAR
jgi:DNA-binding winged helix-turn-helix (wHTH) protein